MNYQILLKFEYLKKNGRTLALNKCQTKSVPGLYFLPAQFKMQAIGKAWNGKKKGHPPTKRRCPDMSG